MTMIPLNSPDPNQQARTWSSQLGNLAAESVTRPEAVASPAVGSTPFSTRLAGILQHIRHRNQRLEHVQDKMRANEFLTGT
jgi:hypothetical protein